MKNINSQILIVIAIIAIAVFLVYSNKSNDIFSIVSVNNIPHVTCTQSNTDWNCGVLSQCTGNLKAKECCKYQVPIRTATEYFYCNEQSEFYNSNFRGSTYGTIKIYLASSPDVGLSQAQLDTLANNIKSYMKEASYGMVDNVQFITEANADFTNPKIDKSRFGTEIKASYYITRNSPFEVMGNYNSQFDSNIPWLFAAAVYHAKYPFGYTNEQEGYIYDGSCSFVKGTSSQNACKTTAHELAHAIFGCEDYEGGLMRIMPDLTDPNHYPPICLEKIKYYEPKLSV